MIEQVNGRYINRYAELDKPFTVKGTHSYTSKTTGVIYESMILTQDGADFNFPLLILKSVQLRILSARIYIFLACTIHSVNTVFSSCLYRVLSLFQ